MEHKYRKNSSIIMLLIFGSCLFEGWVLDRYSLYKEMNDNWIDEC
jgi:hypothetical protein